MIHLTSHEALTDLKSLVTAGQNGLRPEPSLTVSEWSDGYRMLPPTAAEPGRWRTSRTPYSREIMDCLSPSHPCERVTFMKGAQVGASELGLNWVGYSIHHAPGLMLLVMPGLSEVKRNTSTRINPLIDATPALRKLVSEPRSRDGGNSIYKKEFPGGQLVMTGANSAVGLRSTPARYLFLDEIDGYPGDADGEGDPVDLAEQRTVTFKARRKIFQVSTPTIDGESRISKAFDETDQRRYHVPCKDCGEVDWLRWEDIKWPEGAVHLAAWFCPACGQEHREPDKKRLLEQGQWVATADGDGRHVGFHLSALYSPWETWADLAVRFVQVHKDPSRLKVFVNTKLGEPWKEPGEAPEWERLYERREDYPIGSVPEDVLFLTAAADVQADRIEIEVKGWGRDRQSWSIDHRVLIGNTADLSSEAWAGLTEMLGETWPRANGIRMPFRRFAIDEGFNTQEVRAWARTAGDNRVLVIKGEDRASAPINPPKLQDVNQSGKRIRRGMRVWPVGVSLIKSELYRWLRLPIPTDEQFAAGEEYPQGFCHYPQYGEEWFKQLCGEQRVTKKGKGGYPVSEWQKTRERNEALDLAVYNRAAAVQIGMDRWNEAAWDKLEEQLRVEPELPEQTMQRRPRNRERASDGGRSSWMGEFR